MNTIFRRTILYVSGAFVLALGVSFSIIAGFGVSPVSSLPYALALTTGFSVGTMTVVANLLYLAFQAIFSKQLNIKRSIIQLILTVLFGFFINITLALLQFILPESNFILRCVYLIASLFIIAIGLLGYYTAKFPLMPFDGLTYAVSDFFKWKVGKAKTISDLTNVIVSSAICLIYLHHLGSIGIGTFIAAWSIGKILGRLIDRFQQPLLNWAYKTESSEETAM
jgi:uncharacterized membrane protein YczE